MPSIFSKIVAGDIPCAKVWEDDEFLAFLDIRPVKPGHTLVIPKKEIDYLFDIEDALYQRLWLASKRVAEGIKKQTGCRRVTVVVLGFEVPHAHVHLIPTDGLEDLPFPSRMEASQEELQEMAKKIAAAVPAQ